MGLSESRPNQSQWNCSDIEKENKISYGHSRKKPVTSHHMWVFQNKY